MSTEETGAERIWAYVHGELDPEAAGAVEAELAGDAALRRRAEQIRAADRALRALMPLTAWSPSELADRVLRAVERDAGIRGVAGAAPPAAAPPAPIPGLLEWFVRAHAGRYAAALAAAALILAAVLPSFTGGPARWSRPVFVSSHYRGAGQPGVSAYSADDAAACQDRLRAALDEALRQRHDPGTDPWWRRGRPRWRLSLEFREMPQGRFSVRVQAVARGNRPAGEWTANFSGLDDFNGRIGTWAGRIAAEIAGGGG